MRKLVSKSLLKRLLFSWCVLFVFRACADEQDLPLMKIPYAVLIYMAADNSMDKDVDYTIDKIKQGAKHSAGTVLIYLDRKNETPRLFKINQLGKEVLLKNYKEENSASSLTLKRVIGEAKKAVSSKKFGLVLWSHSMSWIPGSCSLSGFVNQPGEFPQTRYTAVDENPGDSSKAISFMEIAAIARDLPDEVAEYIWFDVCLMGNIEALYELRNKARYLIASPTEVLLASKYDASGIPYAKVLPNLFGAERELKRACQDYMKHYESKKYKILRSATISLVKTTELDALFGTTKNILGGELEKVESLPIKHLQAYHTQNVLPAFFDFRHFVQQIASPKDYELFSKQLNRTVIYKAATPSFTISKNNVLTINPENYSGLSVYIPLSSTKQTSNYKYYFDKMAWSTVY